MSAHWVPEREEARAKGLPLPNEWPCAKCGTMIVYSGKGKPRARCLDCAPIKNRGSDHTCNGISRRHGGPCGLHLQPWEKVCGWHGGSVTATKNAALARKEEFTARRIAARYDLEPLTDPWTALAELAAEGVAVHAVLSERLGDLTDGQLEGPKLQAWTESFDRLRKMLTDMSKLDLDGARVTITAMQVDDTLRAIEGFLTELQERITAQLTTPQNNKLTEVWDTARNRLQWHLLHPQQHGTVDVQNRGT